MKTYLSVTFLLLFSSAILAQDQSAFDDLVKDNPLNTAIMGFIVDKDGAPVVNARVTLMNAEGVLIKETETKDNGFFALKNIGKGKYKLQGIYQYMVTEVENVSMDLEVRSSKTQIRSVGKLPLSIKIEDVPNMVDVELSKSDSEKDFLDRLPTNVLVGSVFDENRQNIEGATVVLKTEDGRIVGEVKTSEVGTYVFRDLDNGAYTIQAMVGNMNSNIREVTLEFEDSPSFKAHAVDALVIDTAGKKLVSSKVKPVTKDEFMKDMTSQLKYQDHPLPTFVLKDNTGKEWTNNDLKGRITVMSFWHTGCSSSIREIPELNTWIRKYADVNFISCTWNSAQSISKIVNNTPFLFTHLVDAQSLFDTLNIKITPTTLVIDERGIIRGIIPGFNETAYQNILTEVENRLQKM